MTSFLVVTIPTKLAVEESKRLVSELTSQGIAVNGSIKKGGYSSEVNKPKIKNFKKIN